MRCPTNSPRSTETADVERPPSRFATSRSKTSASGATSCVDHGYALSYVEAGVDDLAAEALMSADLLIVLGGPIGVYETDAYPFLVGRDRGGPPPSRAAKADPRGVPRGAAHGGGARRAGRARPGQGDRLWAGRADRRRPRVAARAPRRPAGLALARRQLRPAGGRRAARLDPSVSRPGVPGREGGARPPVSRRGRSAPDRGLADRPHGRTRQGRGRSARVARRRA